MRADTRTLALLIALAVAAVGCTAQMVKSAAASGSPYAPLNEQRAGIVRYLSDGAEFVVRKRREDAYKQMFKSCAGAYRITAEGDVTDGRVVSSSLTGSSSTDATAKAAASGRAVTATAQSSTKETVEGTSFEFNVHYWYIQYACAGADSTVTKRP